jgi:hypothetical protein
MQKSRTMTFRGQRQMLLLGLKMRRRSRLHGAHRWRRRLIVGRTIISVCNNGESFSARREGAATGRVIIAGCRLARIKRHLRSGCCAVSASRIVAIHHRVAVRSAGVLGVSRIAAHHAVLGEAKVVAVGVVGIHTFWLTAINWGAVKLSDEPIWSLGRSDGGACNKQSDNSESRVAHCSRYFYWRGTDGRARSEDETFWRSLWVEGDCCGSNALNRFQHL